MAVGLLWLFLVVPWVVLQRVVVFFPDQTHLLFTRVGPPLTKLSGSAHGAELVPYLCTAHCSLHEDIYYMFHFIDVFLPESAKLFLIYVGHPILKQGG